jgi:chromosome partitioning protein
MAQIIGVIQVKGGTGKSTIVTNLAGMIATRKIVALIDADIPQATSASWSSIRHDENISTVIAADHLQLVTALEKFNTTHDYILIDAPPRIAEITKVTLMLSNLCLVPLGTSAAEIWATSDLCKIITAAKTHKPDIDVRIIWNRYRVSTRSAGELSEAAHKELQLPELRSRLGYRVAYSEALARGMTALEWPDKQARIESKALGREIERITRTKFMGNDK